MKKIMKIASLMVMLVMWMLPGNINAQAGMEMLTQQLPLDTAVRIGKLPNGLTYFIRHNEYPKGQADFFIAQKVGSILENDTQRGLAHFLEHMCFNGTTHFPGNLLRDWLESIGVKFGANLNAYTSIDETVYNISNVPIARETVQDSCLLILHDWANDLTLDPKEIDAERGVIHEEWRMNNKGSMRILEEALPKLFPGSKYGYRLPIGTMEVVDNFAPQTLRDYYETWYRPDQQGIIVVGDIDVDRIEGKIKEMFADIEMPAGAPERKYENVADHEGTLYAIGSDPEQSDLQAEVMFLYDPVPDELKNTFAYYMQKYVERMASTMLNNRLDDIANQPDAPFSGAGVDFGDYIVAKTKKAFSANVVPKGNNFDEGLAAMYREVLRALRGNFTDSEYDRARNEYLSRWERNYNNRATRQSGGFSRQIANHFTNNEPMPGIDMEYQIAQQLAQMIPLEAINALLPEIIKKDNRAVLVLAPEKEGYTTPTQEQIEKVMAAIEAEDIKPHVDEMRTDPLIPELRKAGKVKKVEVLKDFDAEKWTLSNGATVLVKPTEFKDEEILFGAYANGGTRTYGEDFNSTLKFMDAIGGGNGLGKYTNKDLKKYLAGKQAGVSFDFGSYNRSGSGSTTPKDLKYLMELIYMSFMDMNYDADEFKAYQNQTETALRNQEVLPEFTFQKTVQATLYPNNTLREVITCEDVEAASLEKTNKIAHDMMANAADFTFVFVGKINKGELKKYVEQYIASLPGDAKTAIKGKVARNPIDYLTPGTKSTEVATKMQSPMTYVAIVESATVPYELKNNQMMSIFAQILTTRLVKSIREEMGAVYSIGASQAASDMGERNFALQIPFPMKPELKEQVVKAIYDEIMAMPENVTLEELAPMREYMVKNIKESREKNSGVFSGLLRYASTGVDTYNRAIDSINSISLDDLKKFIKDFNNQKNYQVVVLDPEAQAEESK